MINNVIKTAVKVAAAGTIGFVVGVVAGECSDRKAAAPKKENK